MSIRATIFRFAYPVAKAIWFVTRPKATGVKCVVRKNGRTLMVRHSYGSRRWNFPGGGIKRGESLLQACRREISEETGLAIQNVRHHGSFFWTNEFKRDTIHVFTAETSGDPAVDGHELIEARWVDIPVLPEKDMSRVAQSVLRIIGPEGVYGGIVHSHAMAKRKKTIVAVSGGFDPVHIGHIRMFQKARALGDELVVILNNDYWLCQKKGVVFMSDRERKELLEAINGIDRVVLTSHGPSTRDMSVCDTLRKVKPDIFANGGDRFADNIPEVAVCRELGTKMVFRVGRGGKVQSSSWLLKKFVKGNEKKR